jgi:hypothetical protein
MRPKYLIFVLVAFYLCIALIREAKASADTNVRECIVYVENNPFTDVVSHPEAGEKDPMLTSPLSRARTNAYCKCMAGKMEANGILVEKDSFECGAISRLYETIDT